MAKKAKSDDWTEVDDDSQQARENPQAAEHEKAASAQQTEMQWTELPPENVDVMPTAAVNVALNNREGRDDAPVDAEQLAEQDRKADTERSEKLAKEEEAEARKAGRDVPRPDSTAERPEREPLPSTEELQGMRRSELDELAEARGVDISDASNKDDVIELLRKDARKRK